MTVYYQSMVNYDSGDIQFYINPKMLPRINVSWKCISQHCRKVARGYTTETIGRIGLKMSWRESTAMITPYMKLNQNLRVLFQDFFGRSVWCPGICPAAPCGDLGPLLARPLTLLGCRPADPPPVLTASGGAAVRPASDCVLRRLVAGVFRRCADSAARVSGWPAGWPGRAAARHAGLVGGGYGWVRQSCYK